VKIDATNSFVKLFKQYLTESAENPHLYSKPFTYAEYGHHHGHFLSNGGMIGGLAIIRWNDTKNSSTDLLGFDGEDFDEDDQDEDQDFGDFFSGDGEDF
jgi:hypothetical protein